MNPIERTIKEAATKFVESILAAIKETTVNDLTKLQTEQQAPKKSPGRPPNKATGKRRGRPKGSKNNPKEVTTNE